MFWDWETGAIVRRIEVDATNVSSLTGLAILRPCLKKSSQSQVVWSGSGNLVAICSTDTLYILQFDRNAYQARLDSGSAIGDEGVEEAFEVVAEVSER